MTDAEPTRPRVLVVDDNREMADTLAEGLAERGYAAVACASSADAVKRIDEDTFDALVTDLRMPGVDGMGLLSASRRVAPERPVIVMTGYGAIETAVDAIREGAYHYMTKPFSVDELALFLGRALDDAHVRREARTLRAALGERAGLGDLVAVSSAMREVCDVALRVADATIPVLLLGETGTGKTALAHAIHSASARARRPFVAVNCAALPEALLESELFGHARGAFTGATQARPGLFVESDGGTLLLDEVGEMPAAMQVKLLHVIESGTVRAVGSDRERKVDVRILAATHRDLRQHAQAGSFREDFCTASTSSPSISRRSATAVRTSRLSSSACSPRPGRGTRARRWSGSRPTPWPAWRITHGRATCGSSRTWSNAWFCSAASPRCAQATCPRAWAAVVPPGCRRRSRTA